MVRKHVFLQTFAILIYKPWPSGNVFITENRAFFGLHIDVKRGCSHRVIKTQSKFPNKNIPIISPFEGILLPKIHGILHPSMQLIF